jgi:ketosteroid isomerase-like protein
METSVPDKNLSSASGQIEAKDRLSLLELYNKLAQAIDDGDGMSAAKLFTESGSFVRANGVAVTGQSAIAAFLVSLTDNGTTMRHFPGVPVLEVGVDGVRGRCYVTAVMSDRTGDATITFGEYRNLFTQDGDAWKIVRHQFAPWMTGPLSNLAPPV